MIVKTQTIIRYIEIFVLLLITVAPFDPIYKMTIYVMLFVFNVSYWKVFVHIKPFVIILLFSMIIPMIIDFKNVDTETPYSLAVFSFIAPFILSLIYAKKYSVRDFIVTFENIAFFSSVCSLIGMFFVYFAPEIIMKFPQISYYGRNSYTIILFNAIPGYAENSLLLRNCGLAFEPGAFQFIPNLGLAILLNGKEKISLQKCVKIGSYVLAVILTKSTTGIVVLAAVFFLNALKSKKNMLLTFLMLILFSGIFAESFQFQINKMKTGNMESRFGNSLFVIENYGYKILGIGSTGYDKIYKDEPRIGSWDVYTNMYLRFGLLFTVLFLILNFKLINLNVGICAVIMLTLLTESIAGPIVITLYYYALDDKKGRGKVYENSMGV